jgi:benzylsuccinate CoA-transferase BbsF subunit
MSKLPLEGIRIADFTQVVQGPYSTIMLAQLGAEVIKIETESRAATGVVVAAAASNLNASKKSIVLNLKDPRAVDIAKRLVNVSDIAIENFGTGVMDRFGLSYEDLRKVKPDIIMLSSQALGNTGPLKDAIGYFAEATNFAGVSDLTGYRDGRPGMVGAIWADHLTGMLLSFLMMTALRHRNKTGEGQYIRMSMAENLIASIPEAILDYSISGREQIRQENRDVVMAPHNVYRCQDFDKWVAIAVANEEEWHALCLVMGHSEWAEDERFADPLSRWHNQEELDKLITQWTLQRTDYEVMHVLQGVGVAAGPVLNGEGLVTDPHLNERGCFIPLGEVEDVPYVHLAHPWRLSDAPTPYYAVAPVMGQDTEQVLVDILGMGKEEVAELTKDKVLS